MAENESVRFADDLENEVNDLLLRLGVDPSLSGFQYLAEMIVAYGGDRSVQQTALYARVGDQFGTTGSCVERCCRHAIQKMVNDFPMDRYGKVLLRDPDFDAMTGAYSVSQFVALAWLALMREQSPV